MRGAPAVRELQSEVADLQSVAPPHSIDSGSRLGRNKPMDSILLVALVVLFALTAPAQADGEKLKIHLVSGSAEYKSESSLRHLQRLLHDEFEGIRVTASWGTDGGDHLPGLDALAEADLLIVFARRMNLPEEELCHIRDHFEKEKAAIGIRTASHAFQGYLEMDAEIFGGNYSGHGDEEAVAVRIADEAKGHPILEGVEPWNRPGKIYHNPELGEKTNVLLYGVGEISGIEEPLAWTNNYGGEGRSFYTSMGAPEDFEDERFRKMLFNAIEWTTGRKLIAASEKR